MSQVNQDDLEEKPLDPDMEKVRRKMVRLLAVSIGIMFIGLMAVLGAIVYKFTQEDASGSGSQIAAGSTMALPGDDVNEAVATLPQGFAVQSVALDGVRIGFFGRAADGSQRLIIHDVSLGRIVSDVVVISR
ncbi:hypothetical protein HPDFL43_15087 [Hoeflea phototrophica DFL-43]|jgi:hypothetical protein|uniref:Fimbrial protein n=1 Tax=Hoeflea phototrophica (strain DSM 17068 / NCIMB 14078 / DFL-43) TaxID=411684 RepID=A9D341_HOEPD|nr:hypothetical protein [Hoeflea phototrophica]EDQ34333.1 hypothetical protein HPDFL43_15087 [Hoeflea phototrophica DFL-43]